MTRLGHRMETLHQSPRQFLLGRHRMLLLAQFPPEQLVVPTRHQFVRNAHHFAEHVTRRLAHADRVPEAFAHLLPAIQPLENGQHHRHLRFLPFLLLQVAPDHDIEKLIRAAEFDIGLDHHRIPPLHDRVLHLVGPDRLGFVHPLAEIFPLQHLLQGDPAVQANDIGEGHFFEPLAIEDNLGLRPVQHLESLLLVGLGIGHHFIVRQLRTRGGTAARIADHRREIADDENALMTEILELTQLLQSHRMAEMNIRRRRINPELHPEGATRGEFFRQFFAADDLRASAAEEFGRFGGTHALNGDG